MNIMKILEIGFSFTERVIPHSVRTRINVETSSINWFMEDVSKKVKSTDKVLDAGAGSCPYKKFFSHAKYESTDFEDIFDKSFKGKHDFVCSLDKIPKPNGHYDVIINTQVLEHVEYPQKVIKEFYRILKPGGKLFLTAPQGWGIHGEPYHFFNFTKYGLQSLFRNAGFKIVFIRPMGGMFWYMGNRVKTLPSYILGQYLFRKDKGSLKPRQRPAAFVLFPFYLMSVPFCKYLIPLLFFYMDRLDK